MGCFSSIGKMCRHGEAEEKGEGRTSDRKWAAEVEGWK